MDGWMVWYGKVRRGKVRQGKARNESLCNVMHCICMYIRVGVCICICICICMSCSVCKQVRNGLGTWATPATPWVSFGSRSIVWDLRYARLQLPTELYWKKSFRRDFRGFVLVTHVPGCISKSVLFSYRCLLSLAWIFIGRNLAGWEIVRCSDSHIYFSQKGARNRNCKK